MLSEGSVRPVRSAEMATSNSLQSDRVSRGIDDGDVDFFCFHFLLLIGKFLLI